MSLLPTLPDCVLLDIFELARCRCLLRRVSRWHRLYVDRRLLPSMGGRRVWEALLSRISEQVLGESPASPRRDPWAHRSLRLVAPPVAPVSPRDRRPARLAAWPTLINCLRAAVAVGVARHVVSIDLAFAAPYVGAIDIDALRPFGILTVTPEEVAGLFARTSLRAFSLRAAACDRTPVSATRCLTPLRPLLDRLTSALGGCPSLARFELVDTTPAVYGTSRARPQHGLKDALRVATHLLCAAPLLDVRIEGVRADAAESSAFWAVVEEIQRPVRIRLTDTVLVRAH